MAKSILQTEKECLICGTTNRLHLHHVFYGTANRQLSDEYGLTVWLCPYHHTLGNNSVHFNREMDNKLKKYAQERFEAVYGENTRFEDIFGRNYK